MSLFIISFSLLFCSFPMHISLLFQLLFQCLLTVWSMFRSSFPWSEEDDLNLKSLVVCTFSLGKVVSVTLFVQFRYFEVLRRTTNFSES